MSVRSLLLAFSTTVLVVSGPAPLMAPADAAVRSAPAWGPVRTLAQNPFGESLAVDGASTTTVVWSTALHRGKIQAVRRPSGGGWSAPVVIGHGISPQVAADEAGDVTAVWLSQRYGHPDGVMVAQRPAGGGWSDPVRLTRALSLPDYVPGGGDVSGAAHLSLDASPAGAVVVAWDWAVPQRDEPSRVQSRYQPADGAWGERVDVTPAAGANSPQVGIADDGAAVLVFGRQAKGHPQVLKAVQRAVDGTWTTPVTIAAESSYPQLAVDGAGGAVVVYTPDFNRVEAVSMSAGGQWEQARFLSPRGVEVRDYDLAMNAAGTALVAVGRGTGRVDLVRRSPQGAWSSPARVVAGGTTLYDVVVGLDDARD
ncbi:MAG: domain containing protein, partial [Nocardioides sp.]|nr:domain containing protein [Nocardioides sp.]